MPCCRLLHSPAAALLPVLPVISYMPSASKLGDDDPPWAPLWNKVDAASPAGDGRSVVATVAITEQEHRVSDALVSDRYSWRGYGAAPRGAESAVKQREVTLLAWSSDDAVGTMTMGFDDGCGLLADQTVEGFTAAFRRLYSDRALTREYAHNSLASARRRFGLNTQAAATLAWYQHLSGLPGRSGPAKPAREGAHDYLRKPFKLQEINIAVANAVRLLVLRRENQRLLAKLQDLSAKLEDLQQAQSPQDLPIREHCLLPVNSHLSGNQEFQQ